MGVRGRAHRPLAQRRTTVGDHLGLESLDLIDVARGRGVYQAAALEKRVGSKALITIFPRSLNGPGFL
jgi:hypothetical protein